MSIAPDGGRNFGPRHLDFHPTRPWIYVSIETQNQVGLLRMAGGRVDPAILFRTGTLAAPGQNRARQAASAIHVHPNGRFLYVANRAEEMEAADGGEAFKGGENSIAVYAIDPVTGEPRPIQHIDTRGIHPRCFHIDPSGRILVVEHNQPMRVREGAGFAVIPAGLSVFRIGADGRLEFARRYDIDVGDRTMFWMGMVEQPDGSVRG